MLDIKKMDEIFVDSDTKIITSCPDCGNQNAVYLIKNGKISNFVLSAQWCDNCQKPYVVYIECEISCKIKSWKCDEIPERKKA